MHKCNNCGQEFEGKFCPNCGAAAEQQKTCPNCGTMQEATTRFCNNCGFSFYSQKSASNTATVKVKEQSNAVVWIKAHLKAVVTVAFVFIVAIVLLCLIPTFTLASKNGTYYIYYPEINEVNTNVYIKLSTGKWYEEGGDSGEYKVDGKKVTLYSELFGEKMEFLSGTVSNGVFKVDAFGGGTVYITKNHKHKFGSWTTQDEVSCTTDGTQVRVCSTCGGKETQVTQEALGHTGKWETTKAATCTETGSKKTHCTRCDQDVVEIIEALGHNVGWEANASSHYEICKRCNEILSEQEQHDNPNDCSICGYPFEYQLNYGYYTVSGIYSTAANGDIVIPNTHNGLSIEAIYSNAFKDCSGLTSITIPDGVTSIGNYAFSGCSGLTSITIPDGVTSIGDYAFSSCGGLTSITIPDGVTSIDYCAFYGCSGLTSITIPDGVTSIGNSAFYGCSGLTSITIPDGVTSIGDYAFSSCGGLTSITVGENNAAYASQDGILYNKEKTEFILIPASISGDITIPDGVTSIVNYAFFGCNGLASVTIPNSVTSIGDSTFRGCSGLTSITIPNSVTSIGDGAFVGCSGLETVYWNAANCTRVGSKYPIFNNCTSLANVVIGVNVTNIPEYAFYSCDRLTSIYYTGDIASWCGVSGLSNLMSYSRTLYINGEKPTGDLVIPDGVTSIGDSAFRGCSGLTSVTIPNSVTSIGRSAFSGCSGLTSVTIPDGVTSIGDWAFYGCSGLTSVTIPNGVTSIGDYAFYDCSGLTSVTIPNSVTSIGEWAFRDCSGLTSVTIPNSVTSIGDYAFYGCSGLTSVTIPNSVTSIGDSAFRGCSGLTEINFEGTIKQWKAISKYAYWNSNMGDYTVQCADGTKLDKNGNVLN